eukprot:GEMP01028117.1.p1 GENE.GEMP01028117.1~~GEMP01028117.1.p1  ORF type:complete len:607 (+),score=104.03 GEMP01028117.1:41-1822(+)
MVRTLPWLLVVLMVAYTKRFWKSSLPVPRVANVANVLFLLWKALTSRRTPYLEGRRPNVFENEKRFLLDKVKETTFDYIVVGAGSAGCAVTRRLVDSGASVCLLEAGPEGHRTANTAMPNYVYSLWRSDLDWGHRSEPRPFTVNRTIECETGKTTGGSSCLNYMMWVKGAKGDWDRWAADGCDGWAYEDVEPNFERVCTMVPAGELVDPPEVHERFLAACESVGIPPNDNYNSGDPTGSALLKLNTAYGRRMDCFTTFIEPVIHYRNLTVISSAMVHKLLFDSHRRRVYVIWNVGATKNKNDTCVGVQLCQPPAEKTQHGIPPRQFFARREVVVCCGALNSPKVLLLSGIGPVEELRKHRIDQIADVPDVGRQLQDHTCLIWIGVVDAPDEQGRTDIGAGIGAHAFIKTDNEMREEKEKGCVIGPDLQIISVSHVHPDVGTKLLLSALQVKLPSILTNIWLRPLYELVIALSRATRYTQTRMDLISKFVCLGVILNRPTSRGSVRLRSSDPADLPIVDLRLLEKSEEVSRLIQGLRVLQKIWLSSAMKPYMDRGMDFESTSKHPDPRKELTDEELGTTRRRVVWVMSWITAAA